MSDTVEFSAALWRLMGFAPTSGGGEKSFLEFVHPDHRASATREFRSAISAGETVFENLCRMNAAGDRVQMSLIRAKIVRVGKVAARIEGVVIDVTNLPKLLMNFE